MKKLLFLMVSAGLGLWLATLFVAGVVVQTSPTSSFFGILINENWKFFILFGIILGLLNYFIRPILNVIALPLRIITLGLFSFVINMGLIFAVDYSFKELMVPLFYPLLWTTLTIWALNLVLSIFTKKEE